MPSFDGQDSSSRIEQLGVADEGSTTEVCTHSDVLNETSGCRHGGHISQHARKVERA